MNAPRPSSAPAVLVSLRIDPVSGRATRSAGDAAAAALALQAAAGVAVPRLVHAGRLPERVARDYLALGLPLLQQWVAPVGAAGAAADALTLLRQACADSPLVLTGARAESGLGSGLLPYALAEALQRPLLADVIDLQREPDGHWRVTQALPRGARHHWRLAPGAGAVLVTSARLAQRAGLELRHAWASAQQGRIETVTAARTATAGHAPAMPDWTTGPARRQRVALAAASRASGAERMARATGSGAPKSGGALLREGSVEDKARALLQRLQALALVSSR
jgi:electron transfer flavoprotein beta subunit